MLTFQKNSTYSKCKLNNDTNIILMGINIELAKINEAKITAGI